MSWLSDKVRVFEVEKQRKELATWLNILAPLEASELGLILVTATHVRHVFERQLGVDLLQPAEAARRRTSLAADIDNTIRHFQDTGEPHVAGGAMVWLHTVRASQAPELRALGRELWVHLTRGFPHIEEMLPLAQSGFAIPLETERATDYPEGFAPDQRTTQKALDEER